jgi:hypothetical protein
MRRESPPLLLLVWVETAGKGGRYYCWSHGGGEGKFFYREERERERWCKRHVRLLECLAVMKVVVGGTVARLVATEGVAEKEKAENDEKQGRNDDFFVNFALDFLLAPNMKFAPIYRRWKRAILSSRGEKF